MAVVAGCCIHLVFLFLINAMRESDITLVFIPVWLILRIGVVLQQPLTVSSLLSPQLRQCRLLRGLGTS